MKKLIAIACGVAMVASAAAQTESYKMILNLKNGTSPQYDVDQIENITFAVSETPTEPEEPEVNYNAFSIAIPTSFSDCRVQKVMFNGKKIAEIDYEYIKAVNDAKVVVYPVGEDGYADLTKGVSASDGGTVVWDSSTNTATYTAGDGELAVVYLVDGAIVASTEETEIGEASVEPEYLVDVRGGEALTYTIVKIGTQYWMAENLRATKFANGQSIVCYTSTDTDAWSANTTGAYHIYTDNSDVLEFYGALYNGYAVTSENGLAPEGWEVPTREQWITLRKAGNSTADNFKLDDAIIWNDKQGNNITGFTAYPSGYFSTATGDAGDTTDAYWWTSSQFKDVLPPYAVGLDTARINASSKNIAVSDSAGHSFEFGHSVRCVRK